MAQDQRTLQQLLSTARMTPYLSACGGDWERAVDLYDWNAKVSAATALLRFEGDREIEVDPGYNTPNLS